MARVRCDFCDRRADTAERIEHTSGCPFRKAMTACELCGGQGEHTVRCPHVAVKETR